jgi:hypothetical protein
MTQLCIITESTSHDESRPLGITRCGPDDFRLVMRDSMTRVEAMISEGYGLERAEFKVEACYEMLMTGENSFMIRSHDFTQRFLFLQ